VFQEAEQQAIAKLFLRPAGHLDLPTIAALVQDYKHLYTHDYSEASTLEDLLNEINFGRIAMIDDSFYPVGCFWYEDELALTGVANDLHRKIHVLVRPKSMKDVLRQGIIVDGLAYGFAVYGIKKLKAEALHTQRGAIKLLEKHNFRLVGRQDMEARMNGRYMDMVLFEIKLKRFNKFYKQLATEPVEVVEDKELEEVTA
jgi:hypothetical protein